MRVTVVVPFSRPGNVGMTLANFERQDHPEKRLVLVTNGAALGVTVPGVDICTSESSPAHAKNAGLAWARANGGGLVAFFDDDDHYGPGYLTELHDEHARNPGHATAKAVRYVRFDDGLYYCLAEQPNATHGPTISGPAELLPDFPLTHFEDAHYASELARVGVPLGTLGHRHYVYNRHSAGQRECSATRLQFLAAFGPAVRHGEAADPIADGQEPTSGDVVPRPTFEQLLDELASRRTQDIRA